MTSKIQPTESDMMRICDDFMYRARFAKTEMCKEDPMSDNPPIMLIGCASDPDSNPQHDDAVAFAEEEGLSQPYHIALIPLITQDDPYESFEEIVKAAPIKPFSFIALVVEGYFREATSETYEHGRGSLAEDYKNNPFTDVREGISLVATDWELQHYYQMAQPFRYDDHGVPVFDAGEEKANQVALGGMDALLNRERAGEELGFGRMGDGLIAFVCFMHLATRAQNFSDVIKRAGDEKRKRKDGE